MDAVHEAAALVAEQLGEKIEGATSQLENVVFQLSSLREELVKIADALSSIDKQMHHMY
jgi:hypothetical protein